MSHKTTVVDKNVVPEYSREEHRAFFHEEAYFKHPVQVISPTYQLSTLQIYVQDCASHHKVTSVPFVSSTGQDC